MNYALVDDQGNVVSVAVWDGETPWEPEGMTVVADPDGIAAPGGRYEDGQFIAPQQPEEPLEPQQPEEIVVPERDYDAEIDALEARVTALENAAKT